MNSETYPLQALSYPFILSEYDNIIIFIKCQPITEASRQNKKRDLFFTNPPNNSKEKFKTISLLICLLNNNYSLATLICNSLSCSGVTTFGACINKS